MFPHCTENMLNIYLTRCCIEVWKYQHHVITSAECIFRLLRGAIVSFKVAAHATVFMWIKANVQVCLFDLYSSSRTVSNTVAHLVQPGTLHVQSMSMRHSNRGVPKYRYYDISRYFGIYFFIFLFIYLFIFLAHHHPSLEDNFIFIQT